MSKRPHHRHWSALKTKQSSSSDARENLRRQGFNFFHPTFRMRAVRGVRRVAPLFPNYLLVQIDHRKQDWKALHYTRGVSGVLMSGDLPSRVRDDVVEDLRVLTEDTEDGYYHDPKHDPPRFVPNQSVVGLRGLFEGKYGTYRGLAGNRDSRCRVLFSILGRETEFEVNAVDLSRVVTIAA